MHVVCLYGRHLKIDAVSVTTLEEHQHLVLKVIQSPPETNTEAAAISLLDYKWKDMRAALIKTETTWSNQMTNKQRHRQQRHTKTKLDEEHLTGNKKKRHPENLKLDILRVQTIKGANQSYVNPKDLF